MGSLQILTGKYFYVVQSVKVNGRFTKRYRKATAGEIEAHLAAKERRESINLTSMSCGNPDCDRQIIIPRSQKRELNTVYPLRYKQFSLIYCGEECRQKHAVKELGVTQP